MSKTSQSKTEKDIVSILKSEERVSLSSLLKKIRGRGKKGSKKALKKDVKKALQKLKLEGIINLDRKGISLVERKRTLKGKFTGTRSGSGFVNLQNGEEIFIPQKLSGDAIHGDSVEIVVEKDTEGGKRGRVTKVLKKGKREVIGYIQRTRRGYKLNPIDRRVPPVLINSLPYNFQYDPATPARIAIKDYNTAEFLNYEGVTSYIDLLIEEYGLRREFPDDVMEEASSLCFDEEFQSRERVNLKNENIITIDNDNAKDFDDAVNAKKLKNGNFLLGVHIADVSHYVRPGTALDREAFLRSTSVYFPELVLPMLPEKLSNDLCSLNPGEEKLTMTVIAEIRKDGRIVSSDIFPSIIKSKARMTYSGVEKILNGETSHQKERWLKKELFLMKELAEILWRRRYEEGSIDFDLPEPELSIDSMGKILSMDGGRRLVSERIIEEFMLVANRIVAEFIHREGTPSLYRIHEPPDSKKIEELKEMLRILGIPFPKNGDLNRFYQFILEKIMENENGWLIQIFVLKSLKLARYSPVNKGHFGLAFDYYTHFTSPIRRYPDLIVHRILKGILGLEGGAIYDEKKLQEISIHSSFCERNGDQAEEENLRVKIMDFIKSKVGEETEGFISYLGKDWVEVSLKEYKVDGKIFLTDIKEEIYFLNRFVARGKRSGKLWRIGDKIKVFIASANPLKREIILYPSK